MKASVLDLRRRMKDVLSSLKRNESVTLLRRGKVVGVIHPPETDSISQGPDRARRASSHPAFGLWKDRADLKDVKAFVERLRGGRFDAL